MAGAIVVSVSRMSLSKEVSWDRRVEARGVVSEVSREFASKGTHIAFSYNTYVNISEEV